jgi:hypothetical protein
MPGLFNGQESLQALKPRGPTSIVLVLVLVIELWPLPVKAVTPGEQTRTKAATSSFRCDPEIDDQHGHDWGSRTDTERRENGDRSIVCRRAKSRPRGTGRMAE